MRKRGKKSGRLGRFKTGQSSSGQVWIETVIYTLIGFVIIGLVLAYGRPIIIEMQERAILKQTTDVLKTLDFTISDMTGAGNQRVPEITVSKGDLFLDCEEDRIYFELKTDRLEYSEPGKTIKDGNVIILTEKATKGNLITLMLNYSANYDLKFNGEDISKKLSAAPNPYKLSILNEGKDTGNKIILTMSLI